MKNIQLYLTLLFGLMVQGGNVIAQKDEVLLKLYELRRNHSEFQLTLSDSKTAEIFGPANAEHKPTWDATELRNAIEQDDKLLYGIAFVYYMENEPDWMKDNLLPLILSKKMIYALPTTAKDAVLRDLYANKDKPILFRSLLSQSYEIFSLKNAQHKPTWDTAPLKAAIIERLELLDAITNAYYALHKPDWMRNNLLPYILSQEMIDDLPVIAKNTKLKMLYIARDDPKKFELLLSYYPTIASFGPENDAFRPTENAEPLKAVVAERTELLDAIAFAYYKNIKPDWMKDNLLPFILSQENIDALPSKLKDIVLQRLFKNAHDRQEFRDIFLSCKTAEIFDLVNDKFQPKEENIYRLKTAIDQNDGLKNMIPNLYYKAKQPKWMYNLLKHIYPQELLDCLEATAKNMFVISLLEMKYNLEDCADLLLDPTTACIFSTPNAKLDDERIIEQRAKIGAMPKLLRVICSIYYRLSKPQWMRDNLLPFILSQEMIDALPGMAKDELLKELKQYMSNIEEIFAQGTEESLLAYDTTELKDKIRKKPRLLPLMVNVFKDQGKPIWMQNLLQHVYTTAELM